MIPKSLEYLVLGGVLQQSKFSESRISYVEQEILDGDPVIETEGAGVVSPATFCLADMCASLPKLIALFKFDTQITPAVEIRSPFFIYWFDRRNALETDEANAEYRIPLLFEGCGFRRSTTDHRSKLP